MDVFCIAIMQVVSRIRANIRSSGSVQVKHVPFVVRKLYSKAELGMVEGSRPVPQRSPEARLTPCSILSLAWSVTLEMRVSAPEEGSRADRWAFWGGPVWLPPSLPLLCLPSPGHLPRSLHFQGFVSGWHRFFPWLGRVTAPSVELPPLSKGT